VSEAQYACGKKYNMSLAKFESPDNPPNRIELKFEWILGPFAICKLPAQEAIPEWALAGAFTSVTRTADELSIVCPADNLPPSVNSPHHWICLKLKGPFAFSQVGILAAFINPLAQSGVPIFAISTFDTDYVLIQEEFAGAASKALAEAGHQLTGDDESWRNLIK
jgi:hypothetical protein